MKSWGRDWRTEGTAYELDGLAVTAILYKLLPRAPAKKLNEKASLYEGHGFSRAVNRLCLTASAAEVRFCETHRFAVSLRFSDSHLKP